MIPKYKRIMELAEMEFNTPRMVYVPAYTLFMPEDAKRFLQRIEHQDFVNIRTYKHDGLKETWDSKHLLNVQLQQAENQLLFMTKDGYHCMIDAENPANGLYSGNVKIINNEDDDFILEYCYKEQGGAMVRDADLHISGSLSVMLAGREKIDTWLLNIVRESFNKFSHGYKSVILEWTIGLNNCGVRNERKIFWEYRDKQ